MALRPINVIVSILLARLLQPEDFGAVALAMILLTTSNLFSGLGLDAAIIHSRMERKKIAFHAFVLILIFSLFLFLLFLSNIEIAASFLGDPTLSPILRGLSVLIVLNSLPIVPSALLRKELMYKQIAIASFITGVAYAVVVLWLAYMGYGLWSLVNALLVSAVIRVITIWILCPGWDWIIPIRWDQTVARSLLRYGVKNTGAGLVAYLNTHWDDWLVGRILGTSALGFYSKAFEFTNRTVIQLSQNVISNVFISTYAKLQEEKVRLKEAYLKSVRLVTLIMVPISFGILAVGEPLIALLLGEKWLPMVPALQVFAVMILNRPISANAASLFMAVGHPEYNLRAGLVLIIVAVPLVLLLLPRGIFGVAIAIALSDVAGLVFNLWQANVVLSGTARSTIVTVLPIIVTGFVMMGVVLVVRPLVFLASTNEVVSLGLSIFIGVVTYLALTMITQRAMLSEIWQLFTSMFNLQKRIGRFVS